MNSISDNQSYLNTRQLWPNFSVSMENSFNYVKRATSIREWGFLEERYNQVKNSSFKGSNIPKIIHQIWLGKPMPEFEKQLTEQIKSNIDSNWKYILWTEENLHELNSNNAINLINSTPNYGQKSDILRYEILNKYGGIYLDTDFLMIRPFDEFLDLDFFCGIAFDSNPELFNGLIGSTPNNPIINSLTNIDTPLNFKDAISLMHSTGPYFLTKKFMALLQDCPNSVALPNSFFYPFPNFSYSRFLGDDYKQYIKPETTCCHMWSSSWM